MSQQSNWRPGWDKLQERLAYRKFQIERDLPKFKEKLNKVMIDGRLEKINEEFKQNCIKYYQRCVEVMTGLSGKPIDEFNIPEYDPIKPVDFFKGIEITGFDYQIPEGYDNASVASIQFRGLGEIFFIFEQDVTSMKQEFTVLATRYGLRHKIGDSIRSNRLMHESTPFVIQDISKWTPDLFLDIEIEKMLGKCMMSLIDSLPYYRSSDIRI